MADVDEPQFTTLAERIAALNKQKNFQAAEPKPKKAPPPPPPAPLRPQDRSQTLPIEPIPVSAPTERQIPAIPPRPKAPPTPRPTPPPLPRRAETVQIRTQSPAHPPGGRLPPQLPPRIPPRKASPVPPERGLSVQSLQPNDRRSSNASEVSTLSSLSLNHTVSSATSVHSVDGAPRKLPPAFDPAALPPLPPTKREREAQAREAATTTSKGHTESHTAQPRILPSPVQPLHSAKSTPAIRQIEPPQRPSLPPRLTDKFSKYLGYSGSKQATTVSEDAPVKPQMPRRLPPAVIPAITPQLTINGHGNPRNDVRPADVPPPIPATRRSDEQDEDVPPPIPLSTRPTIPKIVETSPAQSGAGVSPTNDCLTCRDFSGPDAVASQHPRETLPRDDPVGYLAHVLCSPFSSYTDKARAIFTWFHHNIAYDCAAFFGNAVRSRTPEETIAKGAAVCSGYADTYKAIAERAGLECVVVTGHGKGYGHTSLKKGERPPPKKVDGHAWNAVRIDGGEWKLVDSCWGAGNVSNVTKQFTAVFKPGEFTKRNDIFGLSHYPKDERYFFRSDGRIPTWEEYYIGPVHGETPTVYTSAHEEGIWPHSVSPPEKQIEVYSGACVRFQFSKVCEHWTSEKNGRGKPPLLILSIGGRDGRQKDMVPMETDGFWWWVDVNAIDLGAPGESVSVVMLTTMAGRDARGVSAREFLSQRGKVGMSWSGVIKWDLV
ncbi:hypothetical protein ACRALDRAFT_1063245 [Sodiomyces alcalophilus JCM 7366]|uniref:uncharacterized protein n=1 Tax=Sodiomyces alcalophilus JCM 7366 TaxID=591952 RepID=UPI0039B38DA3